MSDRVELWAFCDVPDRAHVVAKVVATPLGRVVKVRERIASRGANSWSWREYTSADLSDYAEIGILGSCDHRGVFVIGLREILDEAAAGQRKKVLKRQRN